MAELSERNCSDVDLFYSDSDGREISPEICLQNETESTLGPHPLREPNIIPTPPRWYQDHPERADTSDAHRWTPGSSSDQDLPFPLRNLRDKLTENEKNIFVAKVTPARKSRVRRRYNFSDTDGDSDAGGNIPSKLAPKGCRKMCNQQSVK